MTNDPLTLPVYLNQRVVFDLLAMTEDGISTVRNISFREEASSELKANAKGSFGLSTALSSLLRIDLTAGVDTKGNEMSERTTQHEKVHTPSSLFFQLRRTLKNRGELVSIEPDVDVKIGDIVEFPATLSRNPFVETLDSMVEMMRLAESFEDPPKHTKASRRSNTLQTAQSEPIRQISAMLDSLKTGNTVDLKADIISNGQAAVIVTDIEYLNDPQMSDLVDGSFKVVGKVIKIVRDESESINLLRKTPFSRISESLFADTFGALQSSMAETGFKFPSLSPTITGPAIQIIPIAIYA